MSKGGKFLLGLGIGAGLGIMLAPKSGEETRKELTKKGKDLVEKVKNIDPEELKENITEKITELQNELRSLDKEKVKKIAVDKAKAISNKAEELYKAAVDKCTPAVQKAAKTLKTNAADTLRKLATNIETEKPKKEAK